MLVAEAALDEASWWNEESFCIRMGERQVVAPVPSLGVLGEASGGFLGDDDADGIWHFLGEAILGEDADVDTLGLRILRALTSLSPTRGSLSLMSFIISRTKSCWLKFWLFSSSLAPDWRRLRTFPAVMGLALGTIRISWSALLDLLGVSPATGRFLGVPSPLDESAGADVPAAIMHTRMPGCPQDVCQRRSPRLFEKIMIFKNFVRFAC